MNLAALLIRRFFQSAAVISLALMSSLCDVAAAEEAAGESGGAGESYPVIYAVKVVGNRWTQSDFILREMKIKVGMEADPDALEYDRLHLLSLGLFNQVEISLASDRGRAVVLVRITERFYIYPYPIFRYDPADPKRRVFGLTLNDDNFRGYGEQLTGGWWDGYENGFILIHRDPWFSYRGLYGVRAQIFSNNLELKGPDGLHHPAKIESFLIRVKRRLTRDDWAGLEMEWEEHSSPAKFYTLNASGRDRLFDLRFYYEHDRRDYKYYPTKGYYALAVLKGNWLADTSHSFFRQSLDLRAYRQAGPLIFATRVGAQFTQKELPWYRLADLTQLDVRSDEPLGLKGSRSLSGSFEVRFNLFPMHRVSLPDIPLAGSYLQKMKLSVEGLVFVDRGYVYIPESRRNLEMTAYGCGLQFQVPYIEIIHATVGWGPKNPLDNPAFVVDTNVTF